jgi:hypothetical protein
VSSGHFHKSREEYYMPHDETKVDPRILAFSELVTALQSKSQPLPLPSTYEEAAWLDQLMRAEQATWAGRNSYFHGGVFGLNPQGVPVGIAPERDLYAIRFGETEWRKLVTAEVDGRLVLGREPLDVLTLVRRPELGSINTYYIHVPQA